ncbi:MAG: ATP-dependent Clp protease ATP-binding subunit [Fimbriimonadaceae bacterium]|nr:ATP-dependent Clp protease ATP-binding subunit [Fimbriimonadaceae bacterium]
MWQRFTERARKVVFYAQEEAQKFGEGYVSTEHLLLGLVREPDSVAARVLEKLGVSLSRIRAEVEKQLPRGDARPSQDMTLTPRAKRVIDLAYDEARNLNNNYIGTEHLLLGLIREGDGLAGRVLAKLSVELERARREVMSLQDTESQTRTTGNGGRGSSQGHSTKTPTLDEFGRDLTDLARDGKLDPVVGRHAEIERVMQILCRRTKNNPCLIGEPGVGKTAIAEGMALRIVSGDIPDLLRDKRIVALDLAGLVAGTKYRGEFEERMKKVMEEVRKSDGQVVLFIDELHTLVGAGAAEGAIDASNIMKPALSRGELQCIGATTQDEYRKYIEKDAALERRFQSVKVREPSEEEAVDILKGLRERYEAHHKVEITDDAIGSAVQLSQRYITERTLPDKAIDLIDEAASRVRLQQSLPPSDVRGDRATLRKMQTELEHLRKRPNPDEALLKLQSEVEQLEASLVEREEAWEAEEKLEPIVGENEIAQVVQSWTGIPVTRIVESESQKLLRMEEDLHYRIIGQHEAVTAVARAIRRSRSGLKDPKRPLGSFVFLGPTGVGKTELAKALAGYLYEKDSNMVRIDMSEYMERFAVSRLVGAPPGYVGYDEGGQLTEQVRRNPYCVVLLDEIEKAHPDVFNILLQIMEDGHLTDSQGRSVDFRNTIIIMTSNVGVRPIELDKGLGFRDTRQDINDPKTYENMKTKMMDEMKKTFRPEFLNRVDELIVFHHLKREEILQIADLYLKRVNEQAAAMNITIELSDAVKDMLVETGYDPNLGARPLRRAVQRYIEDPLSEEMLMGRFHEGDNIVAELDGERQVVFVKKTTGGGKKKEKAGAKA